MGAVGVVRTEQQPQRIPYGAIELWARRHGVAGSAFDLLLELVECLDKEYLAIEAERARERIAQSG